MAEGVLTSMHDANIGSIFGIGFPAWTGGAMQFIASEGIERFLANADELAARMRQRFAIAPDVRAAIVKALPCPLRLSRGSAPHQKKAPREGPCHQSEVVT